MANYITFHLINKKNDEVIQRYLLNIATNSKDFIEKIAVDFGIKSIKKSYSNKLPTDTYIKTNSVSYKDICQYLDDYMFIEAYHLWKMGLPYKPMLDLYKQTKDKYHRKDK